MNGKEKYTDALFNAIGEIDDAYVNEAQNYRPADIKNRRFIKFVSIAASVLIAAVVILPVVLFASLSKNGSALKPSNSASDAMIMSENTLSKDTAALIWQKDGQEDYSYIVISDAKAKTLVKSVSPVQVASRTEPEIKVWIKFSNGEYVSPQLQKSAGNVGLTTFDYSPELELSDTIADIINTSESGSSK